MKSEIVGARVAYATGDRIGKVGDILVDASGPRWNVLGLVVTAGTPSRERLLEPGKHIQVVGRGRSRRLVVRGHSPLMPVAHRASSRNRMRLSFLDGAAVKGGDREPFGKVYDFSVRTATEPWRVDRILVRPKGAKSRRLRVSPEEVKSVKRKEIVLTLTSKEAGRRKRAATASA